VKCPGIAHVTIAVLVCMDETTAVAALPQVHGITGAGIDLARVREIKLRIRAAQSGWCSIFTITGARSTDCLKYGPAACKSRAV
jgi:hypothetical protein